MMTSIKNLFLMNALKLHRVARFALLVSFAVVNLHAQDFRDCESTFANLVGFIHSILTGGFGALIMIVSGIGAILAAAFGQYRAALSALVVALGVFVLQIFVSAFFGGDIISDDCVFEEGE